MLSTPYSVQCTCVQLIIFSPLGNYLQDQDQNKDQRADQDTDNDKDRIRIRTRRRTRRWIKIKDQDQNQDKNLYQSNTWSQLTLLSQYTVTTWSQLNLVSWYEVTPGQREQIIHRVEFKQSLGMNIVSPFEPEREFKVYNSCKSSQIINSTSH